MKDRKVAGLATIKARMDIVGDAILSVIDQLDEMYIYLNYPYEECSPKLKGIFRENPITLFGGIDRGDAGKFIPFGTTENYEGYFFSIDDDLIYPGNYVTEMIEAIEVFERKAIMTNHGRVLSKFPISSYYRDTSAGYHFARKVQGYKPVHFGGTGVMAFHTDTFIPNMEKMKHKFMADIYIADQAQQKKVPIIVKPHPASWIGQNSTQTNIFTSHRTDDYYQTKLINRRSQWRMFRINL